MTLVHDLSSALEGKREEIVAWMAQKRAEIDVPIYGSVDIRDAGWKIAVVDANQFPAGFNNTSESDLPHLTESLRTLSDTILTASGSTSTQNHTLVTKDMWKISERSVSWLSVQDTDARLETLNSMVSTL